MARLHSQSGSPGAARGPGPAILLRAPVHHGRTHLCRWAEGQICRFGGRVWKEEEMWGHREFRAKLVFFSPQEREAKGELSKPPGDAGLRGPPWLVVPQQARSSPGYQNVDKKCPPSPPPTPAFLHVLRSGGGASCRLALCPPPLTAWGEREEVSPPPPSLRTPCFLGFLREELHLTAAWEQTNAEQTCGGREGVRVRLKR